MSKLTFSFIVASILLALIMYLIMGNYYYAGATFLVFVLYYFVSINPKFKKYNHQVFKYHECYYFMNNYVVALNVSGSLVNALDTIKGTMSDEFNAELDAISDFPANEKIKYLVDYFDFDVYKLFSQVINLWVEQGGNILEMSANVINQSRLIEEFIIFSKNCSKKKIIEFSILWIFTFLILVILRFSLTEYYFMMLKHLIFKIGLISTFFVLLVSLEIIFRKLTQLKVRGYQYVKE